MRRGGGARAWRPTGGGGALHATPLYKDWSGVERDHISQWLIRRLYLLHPSILAASSKDENSSPVSIRKALHAREPASQACAANAGCLFRGPRRLRCAARCGGGRRTRGPTCSDGSRACACCVTPHLARHCPRPGKLGTCPSVGHGGDREARCSGGLTCAVQTRPAPPSAETLHTLWGCCDCRDFP
jgi:hypothetical protein